jgi:hypothetical protein
MSDHILSTFSASLAGSSRRGTGARCSCGKFTFKSYEALNGLGAQLAKEAHIQHVATATGR